MDKIAYKIKLFTDRHDALIKSDDLYGSIDAFISSNLDVILHGEYIIKNIFDKEFFAELAYEYANMTIPNSINKEIDYFIFLISLIAQTKLLVGDVITSIFVCCYQYDNKLRNILAKHGITRNKLDQIIYDKLQKSMEIIKNNLLPLQNTHKNTDREESDIEDLEHYGCYLMNDEVKKYDDIVIGRDREVQIIEQTLLRKNKPNIILVGDAGVGKTAIVEKFVKQINQSKKSYLFHNAKIFRLNVSEITAGSSVRGLLEEKILYIIKNIQQDKNNILFIDEIHMIMKDTNNTKGTEISDALKPLLARGDIRVIGATTHEEYVAIFEKDKALKRRFQKIIVKEPSREETIEIISKAIKPYETHHNIKYSKESLIEAVDLSIKYILDKKLPDKAFDLLDSIGSKIKLEPKLFKKEVTKENIRNIFSEIYNIPVYQLENNFNKIFENIKKEVIGQDKILDIIKNYYILSKANLKDDNKNLFNILLNGVSGSGKTFLVEKLAENLNLPIIKINLSEYTEKHTVYKLIGAPPGYVGYSEGNSGASLISKIEKNPYCVLLLDNIHKAHNDVRNIFSQIIDRGSLVGNNEKEVSFKNVIIIATSTSTLSNEHIIGINSEKKSKIDNYKFPEDFVSRFDENLTLEELCNKDIEKIIKNKFSKLNEKLKLRAGKKNICIKLDKNFYEEIINKIRENNNNLREIDKKYNEYLIIISQHILEGNYVELKI